MDQPRNLGEKVSAEDIKVGDSYYYVYFEPTFIKFTAVEKDESRPGFIDIKTDDNMYRALAFEKGQPDTFARLYKVISEEQIAIDNIANKYKLPHEAKNTIAKYAGYGGRRRRSAKRKSRYRRRTVKK